MRGLVPHNPEHSQRAARCTSCVSWASEHGYGLSMYISSPRSSQAANAGRQVCQEDRGIPKSGTGEDMPRKPLDRRRAGREGIQFPQPFVTVNCECLQLSPFWRFNFLHFCLQLFPKSTCKKQLGRKVGINQPVTEFFFCDIYDGLVSGFFVDIREISGIFR